MSKKVLRVGFDLDGVILYNPARVVRPIISLVKRLFLTKRKLAFYYPRSPIEKWMWKQLHRSSIFIAPGMDDIKKLVKEKKIKAYIVTARYGFLGGDFIKWVKENGIDHIFDGVYYNKDDEQPHLFKEMMIKKLNLDMYVEDNFDIVNYLEKMSKQTKIVWIYNIFDHFLSHPHKFPSLKRAVQSII